jgi:uroporphyrinogen III methyltransferase/synthase
MKPDPSGKVLGKVFLVGAGPGAVDLITLRGAETLSRAEVVIYDSLVNPGLLRLAPAAAELIYAGKRGGGQKDLDQREINAMLIDRSRNGAAVVRLKGGDPFIFGRGGEEAEALAAAGVAFEVVPGITSAIAVPAFAGIPLTHRDYGSFVAFVTGHEDASKGESSVPWDELARAANSRGTLVILMATARLRGVLKRLADAGLPPATPAAAIQWGTIANQKTISSTLATLADEAERAKLGAPAVVVVGQCAELREHLKWAERMPLFGRRIVITRATDKVSTFARELRALGAEVIEFPTIETIAPDSYATLDAQIGRLTPSPGKGIQDRSFDWIIFTSATGVEAFVERLRTLGKDIRAIGKARIAAIGPATAEALKNYALSVDAMPGEYRGEAIIDAIGVEKIRGARILIPRAQVAREVLAKMLQEQGAAEVVVAPAYKTIAPSGAALDRMRESLSAGGYDLVAFTSSSTASNFVEITGKPKPGTMAAAIGPITASTAEKLGFEVVAQPYEYTIPALVAAIREYFTSQPAAS